MGKVGYQFNSEMPDYLSTDPSAGLDTEKKYLSTDPNAGVQPSEQPSGLGQILKTAGEAALETAKGFVKGAFTKPDLRSIAEVAFVPAAVAGATIQEVKGAIDTVKQVQQAEQTPAWSKERFEAGFNVVGQMGMLAGIAKLGLRETAFGKAPTEAPLAETAAAEQIAKGGEISATKPDSETGAVSTEQGKPAQQEAAVEPQARDTRQTPAETPAQEVAPVPQPEQLPTELQNPRFKLLGSRGRGEGTATSDYDVVTTLTPEEYKSWVNTPEGEYPVIPQEIKNAANAGHDVFIETDKGQAWKVEPHPISTDPNHVVVERVSQIEKNLLAGEMRPVSEGGKAPTESTLPAQKESVSGAVSGTESPPASAPPATGGISASALSERPIKMPEGGTPVGWQEATAHGHDWLDKGGDPSTIINAFRKTGKIDEWDIGRMSAATERIEAKTNAAGDALSKNPNDPNLQAAYDEAKKNEQTFADAFRPMATTASNTLKGFQGKRPLTSEMAASYTGLNRKFIENMKRDFTPEESTKARTLSDKTETARKDYADKTNDLYKAMDAEYKPGKRPPTIQELASMFKEPLMEVCDT